MAKHHLTRREARMLKRAASVVENAYDAITCGIHSVFSSRVNRRHKPRKRPAKKWQGFAAPSQAIKRKPAKVTDKEQADAEDFARKYFGS